MARKSLFFVLFLLSTMNTAQAASYGDLNCDNIIDVVDVVLSINIALEIDLSEILDPNQNNIPDACEPIITEVVCEENTVLNGAGDGCVIAPGVLEAATAEGFDAGVISGFADGVASVNTQASFDEGYLAGVASVDTASFCGAGTALQDGACVSTVSGECPDPLQILCDGGVQGACCDLGSFEGCQEACSLGDMGACCDLGDTVACEDACDNGDLGACPQACYNGNLNACELACDEGDSKACQQACLKDVQSACCDIGDQVACCELGDLGACAIVACSNGNLTDCQQGCDDGVLSACCALGDQEACGVACQDGDAMACCELGTVAACLTVCNLFGDPGACEVACENGDQSACCNLGDELACPDACQAGNLGACCKIGDIEACQTACDNGDQGACCQSGDMGACSEACENGDDSGVDACFSACQAGDQGACVLACGLNDLGACQLACAFGDPGACAILDCNNGNPGACVAACNGGNANSCVEACLDGNLQICCELGDLAVECQDPGGDCTDQPCYAGLTCVSGVCVFVSASGEDCTAANTICDSDLECVDGLCEGSTCAPSCEVEDCEAPPGAACPVKVCGDDGCGGSCGTCNFGFSCSSAGTCFDPGANFCPCGCDQSESVTASLEKLDDEPALAEIDRILAIQAEREHHAGYITEAMIAHRLRLLAFASRTTGSSPQIPGPSAHAIALRQARLELPPVTNTRLQVRTEMIAYGDYREQIQGKDKHYPASFRLWMEVKNLTGEPLALAPPTLASNVPLPVSRWFQEDTAGKSFDGRLE